MSLVRFYNPRYSVNRNLVNEMFNSFLTNDYHENYVNNCKRQPATNVFETETDFRIEMLCCPVLQKKMCRSTITKIC
jgi:HSP20 family protein